MANAICHTATISACTIADVDSKQDAAKQFAEIFDCDAADVTVHGCTASDEAQLGGSTRGRRKVSVRQESVKTTDD